MWKNTIGLTCYLLFFSLAHSIDMTKTIFTIFEWYEYKHHFLLQMVDYQMLKEDNSVLRRELDGMKT